MYVRAAAWPLGAISIVCMTVAGCSSGEPITVGPTSARTTASVNGLVVARHRQCDFGDRLLRYLATGDNGGEPWYDQQFANDVGVSVPEARAIADEAIQKCDADLDRQAAASAAETASAAAKTSEVQAAAAQVARRKQSCAAIGGRYDDTGVWCASTVQGNPSGEAGADCRNSRVPFEGDGIDRAALAHENEWYPGCFPNA